MRSWLPRVLAALTLIACVTTAYAAREQKGKDAIRFPMTSEKFRPFFDKLLEMYRSAAAQEPEAAPPGWEERMRFRAAQATEDGVVTEGEFQYVLDGAH